FTFSNLKLSEPRIGPEGETSVSVDVTNTGSREGDEVAQMYIRDRVSSITRPVKELKGFERVTLKPGETRTVHFKLTPAELGFYNINMDWVVEPGMFDIMVGPNSAETTSVPLQVTAA
ncbi:MAG: fibronectin type III-like domain-contianing protein, partial [Bryobacteraceae bacterium]